LPARLALRRGALEAARELRLEKYPHYWHRQLKPLAQAERALRLWLAIAPRRKTMKFSIKRIKFPTRIVIVSVTLTLIILASGVSFLRIQNNGDEESLLAQPQPPVVDEEGDDGGGRANWFYLQRAYPLGSVPPAARAQAIEQLDIEEKWMDVLSWVNGEPSIAEMLPAWTPLGPVPIPLGQTIGTPRGPVSGRISTIALDPGYNGVTNQTVYLGAAQGGVWRSTDNGANWTPLTDSQPSLATGAIAIDPTNPNVIYVGTGEGHLSGDSYYGAGLLKSVDGGATWTQITGPVSSLPPNIPAFINATFHTLAIDPVMPATIFAATESGITMSAASASDFPPLGDRGVWKSTDGGMTWRNVNPPNLPTLDKAGTDVLIDPLNHNRVFAAVREAGIFRSTMGGEPGTWQKLTTGLPVITDSFRIELASGPPLAPSSYPTLYAAFSGNFVNTTLRGLFKSTDGGDNWTQVATPSPTMTGTYYALALAVDPVDANTIYYGTIGTSSIGTVQRSSDGGLNWANISQGNNVTGGLHVDTHGITISPANRNILFTANDGGVWRTDNATGTPVAWTNLNQTLNITQFQGIALHPTNPNRLLGGTQDNGTNRYDGAPAWFHSFDGDGGFSLIDQSIPNVMYATRFNTTQPGFVFLSPYVSFSSAGFNQFFFRGTFCFTLVCPAVPGRLNPTDRVSFYAPMAQHTGFNHPTFGNVIYFGTHRLYRSANTGLNWAGLGPSADGFGADLTTGVVTFPFSSGFPAYLTAIAAHPRLDNSLNPPGEVVWTGSGDGLVHVTTNAGNLGAAIFTNVTKAPLPNRFITDIALDPSDQLRAVVTYSGFNTNTSSTPGHVFLTTDQGATWRNISGNLPDLPVNSVALDPTSVKVIYAGTDFGVFQTVDGGATWIRLSNGMPNVTIPMLRLHTPTRGLVAATHGRGVFRLMIDNAPLGCVRGHGYWKTHEEIWPVTGAFLGNQLYSQAELLNLLSAPVKGDASIILAHQLIAAKLNIANGSSNAAIAATLTAAENWLHNYAEKLPFGVKTSTPAGQTAVNLANSLEQYNTGALAGGPPSCN
jgi:photosystem II stability/assembly factor-like uncharacterized protein